MNELAVRHWEVLEKVVVQGDLSKLTPQERVLYYRQVCESLGLNPLTRPFDYIVLNGKLTLYARKDATDQLRRIHGISVHIVGREFVDALGLYVVTARATAPDGRTDEAVGAVSVKGLSGENLANAIMKAETKAKRRVTLSLVGLGWTDESEVDSIPGATRVEVDMETGEILSPPAQATAPEPAPQTEKQRKLLKLLMERVGLQDRSLALSFARLALARGEDLESSRDLSLEETSRLIDILRTYEGVLEEKGATPEEREQLMRELVAHGEVPAEPEVIAAVVDGMRVL
ncbi:hypothetical protein CSW50_02410 [Thermus scotoductus]|uniref:Uncharacterized protein n=1 Tax=Thermus scotoductus TaxID=37636 RepID=A0A430RB01_THESC|nr:hypothetical protein [Thermus scotoductus]RTH04548.1 hypothetical protein CSW50_02410 [Thermus scotoductus]